VHGGPFGNIAHGCNSIVATKLGLALGDIVLTEAGFGADLGAEKFFDIKCRFGGLNPEAAVIVATVRALKMHGGVKKDALSTPDVGSLRKGLVNLEAHVKNIQKFGVPAVVALNRFTSDSDEELQVVLDAVKSWGARGALSEVWAKGGEGGEAVGREVLAPVRRIDSVASSALEVIRSRATERKLVLVGLKPTLTVQVPRGTAGVAVALPAASVALTQVLETIAKSPGSVLP